MLFETKADLVVPLIVTASLLGLAALGAGIIAFMNMFRARATQEDLTQSQRKIDNLERRMFHVLNAVPVALFETDATGKYTFANKAAHMLVGRKDSELLGLRYHSATWGITYPDGRVIPADLLPLARALRGQTVKGFQHQMAQPHTHDKMLVSVTAMPITNANGEVIGATSAVVELETQAGEGVGDLTGVWRGQWFSAAALPFWGLDQDGTVLDLNPAAADALGYERDTILGVNWAQILIAESDFQTALDYLAEAQSSDARVTPPEPVRIHIKDARGALRPMILSAWKVSTRDTKTEGLTVTATPAPALRALKAERDAPVALSEDDAGLLADLKRAESARAALGAGAWFYDSEADSIIEDAGMRALIGREYEGGPTLISDADQARADQAFIRLMSGQARSLDLDIRVDHPEGARWISLKGLVQGEGEDREVFGVATDITAFKDALEQEAELRRIASEKAAEAERIAAEAREKAMAVVNEAAPTASPGLLEKAEGLIGLTRTWVRSDEAISLKTLSPQWMTTTGLSAHEFLGDGWLDAIAEDDQARVTQTLEDLIDTQSEGQISYRLQTGLLVLEYLKPIIDASGRFDGLLGLGFDITHHVPVAEAVASVAVEAADDTADNTYAWHEAPAAVVIEDSEAYLSLKAEAEALAAELEALKNAPIPEPEPVSEIEIESSDAYLALQAELSAVQDELAEARADIASRPEPEVQAAPDVEDFAAYQLLKARAEALSVEVDMLKSRPEPEPVAPAPVPLVDDFAEYQALKAHVATLEAELQSAQDAALEAQEAANEAARIAAEAAVQTPPASAIVRPEDVPEYLTLKAHANALEAALEAARAAAEDAPRPEVLAHYQALQSHAAHIETQLQVQRAEADALRERLFRLESLNGALEQSEAQRQTLEARAAGLNAHIHSLMQQQAMLEARSAKLDEALAMAQRFETVGRLTGNVANDFTQMLSVINNALDLIRQQSHNPDNILRLSEAALAAGRRGERLTRQLQAFTQQDM